MNCVSARVYTDNMTYPSLIEKGSFWYIKACEIINIVFNQDLFLLCRW